MTSGGGQVEEARPFPMINSNDSTTSSPTLSSVDSYDENMGGVGVIDQSNVSPKAKTVHPGERVFNWTQQQQQSGDNSNDQQQQQPVTLTNMTHLTPISPSNEVHSAEQYKHPQPSVLRYPFASGGGYYYTGFHGVPGLHPTVFTMPENEKYRKMLIRKQKRDGKKEKHFANSIKAEDIEGHKDIGIEEILQSMGETVEEDKKSKSKKVKAEKSKPGKKEKRKGSSEQSATASDNNVDNDEDEAEDIKVDEEEKKETKAVRNQFVEEDLMSFKQNFYLVNSDDSRSRDNGPIVEEILASPSQSSFTKVTSKKNRGKKIREEPVRVQQVEEPPRSYQAKPREREFIRRKETSPEVFPPVEKQTPTPVPSVTDTESFPTLLKDDFPALPGGLSSDNQGQLKDNIKDTEPRIGAWSRIVTKASDDNNDRGHNTDTGAIDDHEKETDKEEEKEIVVEQQEVEEVTVIEDDDKVPKQPEEQEVEVVEDVQETNEDSDDIVADQNSNCDEEAEEEMEILAEKIRVVTTEEEFDQKETNEHSPVVIFSENNQDWTSSEFTFGFDVNEDLVANSNPIMPSEEAQQPSEAGQQFWPHPQSNLQLNDNAILSFGAATAGPGPDGVRPLIVGVPVGVPIPVSSYHQGLSFYPGCVTAPGPVLQYPYTFPFPGQPQDQEDPELAGKMVDQCHEDATISPESGISSSSPLSWQPDASPSLAAAPGCYPTPGPLVSQVSKSLSNWKGHGSDHEEEGPGWATQVDMENAQDSGLASENSLSSLKSRKTERFNIGEIVHFISDSWSSVSGDSSIPVFSSAASEGKVPVA